MTISTELLDELLKGCERLTRPFVRSATKFRSLPDPNASCPRKRKRQLRGTAASF